MTSQQLRHPRRQEFFSSLSICESRGMCGGHWPNSPVRCMTAVVQQGTSKNYLPLATEEGRLGGCGCLISAALPSITLTVLPQRDLWYTCCASSSSGSLKVTSDIVSNWKPSQRKHLGQIVCYRLCLHKSNGWDFEGWHLISGDNGHNFQGRPGSISKNHIFISDTRFLSLTTISIELTVLVFKTLALFWKQKGDFPLRPKCKCVTCTFPQASDSLQQ